MTKEKKLFLATKSFHKCVEVCMKKRGHSIIDSKGNRLKPCNTVCHELFEKTKKKILEENIMSKDKLDLLIETSISHLFDGSDSGKEDYIKTLKERNKVVKKESQPELLSEKTVDEVTKDGIAPERKLNLKRKKFKSIYNF
jgi:hypothetical protein